MIPGVDVISAEMVTDLHPVVFLIIYFATFGSIFFIVSLHNSGHKKSNVFKLKAAGLAVCMITIFAIFIYGAFNEEEKWLRVCKYTKYEVIVDKEIVSLAEFYGTYEVIEQRGDIYVVREREKG